MCAKVGWGTTSDGDDEEEEKEAEGVSSTKRSNSTRAMVGRVGYMYRRVVVSKLVVE